MSPAKQEVIFQLMETSFILAFNYPEFRVIMEKARGQKHKTDGRRRSRYFASFLMNVCHFSFLTFEQLSFRSLWTNNCYTKEMTVRFKKHHQCCNVENILLNHPMEKSTYSINRYMLSSMIPSTRPTISPVAITISHENCFVWLDFGKWGRTDGRCVKIVGRPSGSKTILKLFAVQEQRVEKQMSWKYAPGFRLSLDRLWQNKFLLYLKCTMSYEEEYFKHTFYF